jgi:hypothetical protein
MLAKNEVLTVKKEIFPTPTSFISFSLLALLKRPLP